MKLFLDANILFTASHNPEGKACFLFELQKHGKVILMTSDYAFFEAEKNILKKYPECHKNLIHLSQQTKILTSVMAHSLTIDLPPKDIPILITALKYKAQYLITGDIKNFGKFMKDPKKTVGITILTVSDFLQIQECQ